MTTLVSTPWYRRFREKFSYACGLLDQYEIMSLKMRESSIDNFDNETRAQFIFESNSIEKEGLTFGETKKMVFSEYSELDTIHKARKELRNFYKLLNEGIPPSIELHTILNSQDLVLKCEEGKAQREEQSKISFIATYGVRAKDARTVYQHLFCLKSAEYYIIQSRIGRLDPAGYRLLLLLKDSKDAEQASTAKKLLHENYPNGDPTKKQLSLLDEKTIKILHAIMAEGLIDGSKTPEGVYRKHPIMTDFESNYPAWEAVPESMSMFIEQFRIFEKENINPIYLAAWASTRLVAIHPFSDFNGRISRLIMNMILRQYGLPFWVSLKASSRERRKYFTALRHYRRGNLYSITTLLSNQIIETFNRLNYILSLSNYPQVIAQTNTDEFEGLNDYEVLTHTCAPLDDLIVKTVLDN